MKSNRDESLVNFLKQKQPMPPAANPDAEESLFALIDADTTLARSLKRKPNKKVIWLIPTAIAAGLTITWGRYQSNVLSPQWADQSQEPPVLTADQSDLSADEDLELYLETAWGDPFTDSDLSGGDLGYAELISAP